MKNKTLIKVICLLLTLICLYEFTLHQGVMAFAEMSAEKIESTAENSDADANSESLESYDDTLYEKIEYSPLLEEVTELRNRYEKRFQREDRVYEAVMYSYPVHYSNNGKWESIDNTLIEDKKADGTFLYTTTANEFSTNFSSEYTEKTGNLVSMKRDGYTLSWNLVGFQGKSSATIENNDYIAAKTNEERDKQMRFPAELTSKIKYNNIAEGTTLSYVLTPTGLIELIELESQKQVLDSYTTLIKASSELIAKQNDDGSIIFIFSDQTIFMLNAPFMYDLNGQESRNIKVTFEVDEKASTKNETAYVYTIIPDKEWLSNKERVYPVVIDPTVTTPFNNSTNSTMIIDSFVSSGLPTQNNQVQCPGMLKIGYGNSSGYNRTYVKFPSLPTITSGDMVISSSLYMARSNVSSTGDQMNLYQVTDSWVTAGKNALVWDRQPTYDSTVKAISFGVSQGNYNSWEVTDLMKKWYAGEINNNGVMIRCASEGTSNGYYEYFSSDVNYYTDAAPFATVVYMNSTGIEDMWSYHTQDVQNAGTGYVNDYNGHLTFIHDDGVSTGGVMPASISHVYNSNDRSTDIGYGKGWRINYAQTIEKVQLPYINKTSPYYKQIDGDGTVHYYQKSSSDSSVYENEFDSSLKLTISGTRITITDSQDNKLIFDGSDVNSVHYLRYMKDANGNETEITYDSNYKITNVYDGVDNCFVFNYDANGRVNRIHVPGGQSVGYEYESNGTLATIKYYAKSDAYVSSSIFEYSDYYLTSVTDSSGYKISYAYITTNPKRVLSVAASSGAIMGQSITYAYGWNKTLITDNSNRTIMYQFNNMGQAISIRDVDGSAQYCSFNGAVGKTAQLSSISKLQKTTINLLKNHNMEYAGEWYNASSAESNSTLEYNATKSFIGTQSLAYTKTGASVGYIFQSLAISGGETYTLSGYLFNGIGVKLIAGYYNKNNSWQGIATEDVIADNEWTRSSLTFTTPTDTLDNTIRVGVYIPSNVMFSSSNLYLDCFMLEKADAVNRYNLLENSDFTNASSNNANLPASWNAAATVGTLATVPSGNNAHPTDFSNQVFKITGLASSTRNLSQEVIVSGVKGDTFTFGGWMRADSIPTFLKGATTYGERKLTVQFYCGTEWKAGGTVSFNSDTNEWQYACSAAVAPNAYTKVRLRIEYNRNCNYAYFDGMQLFYDEFAQSYTYDAKGNLISVAALANQNSTFQYNGSNDLTSYTDPKGKTFSYTYDNYHNVKTATSATSTIYNFFYDREVAGGTSFGKPIRTMFGKNGSYIGSSAEYDAKGHMSKVFDARGKATSYVYTNYEGLLSSVTDPNGNVTTNSYDNQNRLTGVSVDSSNVTYGYDANNRLNRITRNGWYYSFTYDAFGNPYQTKVNDATLITNNYNTTTGLLTSTGYGNGLNVTYVYDNMDRVKEVRHDGNLKFTYAYDGEGNLSRSEDKVGGVLSNYYYDTIGRIAKVCRVNGNGEVMSSASYNYDNNNNVSSVYNTNGNASWWTSYQYDDDNRLITTGLNSGDQLHYAYNDTSTMESRAYKT
ncbi:MAG: DNRLRE domain-containing protein, partial [Christensenellaceae bacterium]